MNPAFLDGMSWEMAEVYGAISDQILINLAKYFPYYKPGATVPKSAFTYQSMMLAQMGQVNAETVAIIRRGLKDANSALNGVLEQAIIDSVRTAEKPLYKAVKQGIFSPPLVPIVSPNQTRALQLYYAQACDKLNLVNTVMLESTGSAYRQAVNDVVSEMQINDRIKKTQTALDIGAGETATGVSSWNQALRHTVERMKATGITGFVDHAGRHWSAEAYAAMDIRTTVWNTSRAAVWETNQNFGNDLYSVSFHNGARPGCYDWQNRVISSTNNARTVTDLDGNEIYVVAQSDTSYGQAAGLFGINCKHYPTPFIPGVSIIRGHPQSPEENERTYAESQEQRRLERKLREEKRDIMMAKAQGASDEEIKALQARARNTSQDIDDFCESTGRTRHRDREGVYTQRSFPSKDSYDVSQFENEQKKKIDQFYQNGGAQRQYQAGVMEGKATQTTPTQGTPVEQTPSAPTNTPPEPEKPAFTPAKTREEAEVYARDNFADSVSYKGISVERCNEVNKELTTLYEKYPETKKLSSINARRMKANAKACYDELTLNPQKLGAHDNGVFEMMRNSDKMTIQEIQRRYDGKKIPPDMQKQIAKLENSVKYERWSVAAQYGIKGDIDHEYGHIIADQYFGQFNYLQANPNANSERAMKTRKMVDATRDRAFDTGDIFKLSKYGSTSNAEFFAEVFCAYENGETMPGYFYDMIREVVDGGIL